MCGLVGYLEFGRCGARAVDLDALCGALHHRGPDANGSWRDDEAGILLVHVRLSIIDLSPTGAQPMHSACGRYVLAFNGEIYNHRPLRAELEQAGVAFRGTSDTEVLLAAIVRYGLDAALSRADGMFAIALWDRVERRLSLARDRIGEKPLYYGMHDGRLVFASELKALFAMPGFRPAIDRSALALFVRHDYVPDPWSLLEGISKLSPGHVLTVSREATAIPASQPWWTLSASISKALAEPFSGSAVAAVDALEDVLSRAVTERMVADVPLGAFLSGGIDSSTVVALMQAQSVRPVRTFSIGFDIDGYDEAPHARAVARHLGTDHTELYVSAEEARSTIPQLCQVYDEPFADSSQIPTLIVSRLARQHVTVAMSGDAGDELFAGYSRYTVALELWRRLAVCPLALRRAIAALLRMVPARTWDVVLGVARPLLPAHLRFELPGDKLHKAARMAAEVDPLAVYRRLISVCDDPLAVVRSTHEPVPMYPPAPAELGEIAAHMMYRDAMQYLPGDILVKVDRAAMAASLETRVPFLAHDVLRFAWSLPHACKVRDGVGKWVLRELLARHVPRALFERPKMGFGVPIDHWLRGALRPWAEDLLAPERLRAAGYFDVAAVRGAWQTHVAGKHNLAYHLWAILMFESWRDAWGY
ncbi:MAG: asparagine synthase (glutamine-hydrolyzing) [Gammaproteobacteria bacterium]